MSPTGWDLGGCAVLCPLSLPVLCMGTGCARVPLGAAVDSRPHGSPHVPAVGGLCVPEGGGFCPLGQPQISPHPLRWGILCSPFPAGCCGLAVGGGVTQAPRWALLGNGVPISPRSTALLQTQLRSGGGRLPLRGGAGGGRGHAAGAAALLREAPLPTAGRGAHGAWGAGGRWEAAGVPSLTPISLLP